MWPRGRSLRTIADRQLTRLQQRFNLPVSYQPDRYWEGRASELIAAYDDPDSWANRGWLANGVEEAVVPRLLREAAATSVFVVGAGTGRQYAMLSPLGVTVRGIDISSTLAAECQARYPHIQTARDTLVGMEDRHAAADAVLSTAVLQHVRPDDMPTALHSVQAMARKLVVLRESVWLKTDSHYQWGHEYLSAFSGWTLIHDEQTDLTPRVEVRLLAWRRP